MSAQSDALIVGNGYLDVHNNAPAPVPLPAPGAAVGYAGQPATRSQVARTDGNGNLLFFGIDGNIYDDDGYLIADGQGGGCSDCIYPGTMEMLAVPVPGECFMYYLLSMNADTDPAIGTGETHIQVSFLDMASVNPATGRYGVVRRFEDMADAYPQFTGFVNSLSATSLASVTGLISAGSGDMKSSAPRLRAIDPTGTGDHYFLYALVAGKVFTYEITGTGIHPLNLATPFSGRVRTIESLNPAAADSYVRDADVRMLPDGRIMLAMTGGGMNVWHPATNTFDQVAVQALVMYFNGTTGQFLDVDGVLLDGSSGTPDMSINGLPTGAPTYRGTKGIAIVDGGNSLLISGEQITNNTSAPNIIRWDLINSTWDDIGALYAIADLPQVARVRMYHSTFPGTLEPAILLPKPGGFTAFVGTENTWSMVYEPLFSLGASNFHIPFFEAPFGTAAVEPEPRFLNAQIVNDQYASGISGSIAGACCVPFNNTQAESGYVLTANDSWSPADNPFGTSGEVRFTNDLVVSSGTSLSLNNMTLRFAEDARLIIQRGATVDAAYCTFTSFACEGQRWPGIRVEGNTANPYQGNNPALSQDEEQGFLRIHSSTIENAHVGVWCTRQVNGNADPLFYGGYVRAYHTGFHNCQHGVMVQNYQRFDGNDPAVGPELANRSYFAGCKFEIDQAWPGGQPGYQGFASNVRHIQFLQCKFENSAPELFPPNETGTGLFLFNSTIYVDGNGDPDQNYIKGFYMGVFNASATGNSVRVAKMHFDNNVYGIADLQSSFVEYGENTFVVRDQGENPNPRVGMLLWETKKFTIEENRFQGETRERSVGIYFVGVQPDGKGNPPQDWTYAEEHIYNNTFDKLQAGTLISGLHRGDASSSVDYGLQLLCGDYTDNLLDIALLNRSIIRPNQGTPGDEGNDDRLAGNRFFTGDCQQSFDWTFDADWNDVAGYTNMLVNYKRHQLPDPIVGVDCSGMPDLDDYPVPMSGLFNKTEHCADSKYPIQQSGLVAHQSAYLQAKALLKAATNSYEGTVDLGDTPDLKQALLQGNPVLNSSYLRDLLLAKHPLSDDILILMLEREVALDQWHLTQVLLQNSRLSPGIWRTVQEAELLSPILLAMLAQAQSESGGPTAKELLEQEIVQRRLTMTEHLNVLGHIYARDTTGTPTDSLKKLMLNVDDKENRLLRFETLMKLGRYAEAQAVLNGELDGHIGKEVLEDLLAMQQATAGDWKLLNEADKNTLYTYAEEGRTGAAQAAAILLSLEEPTPMPPVRFPDTSKARRIVQRSKTVAPADPTLACYPNPSNASTYLTYPAELDGSTMVVLDAKGCLVRTQILQASGLLELDTKQLPEGMYQVAVPGSAFSTKLSVQH